MLPFLIFCSLEYSVASLKESEVFCFSLRLSYQQQLFSSNWSVGGQNQQSKNIRFQFSAQGLNCSNFSLHSNILKTSILDFLTLPQPFSIPQRKFEPVNKAKLKVPVTLNETLLPLLECTPTSVLWALVSNMPLRAFRFSAYLAVSGKLKTLPKLRAVCIWTCYSPKFAPCSFFSPL